MTARDGYSKFLWTLVISLLYYNFGKVSEKSSIDEEN